jgi:hypothetical protein
VAQRRLSGVNISDMKVLALEGMPSSNFDFTACSTQSTHLAGAGKFFATALAVLRANWK